MTAQDDIQNFQRLIKFFFKDDAGDFRITAAHSNPVITALNKADVNNVFASNFKARLRRLSLSYQAGDPNRIALMSKLAQIATRNWRAFYSEIVTYDYLNFSRFDSPSNSTVLLDVDIDGTRTYSRELKKPGCANLDGYFSDSRIFFDVKVFQDIVKIILEGVFKEVYKRLGTFNFSLRGEYDLTSHYNPLASRRTRTQLVEELVSAFNPSNRNTYMRSTVLPGFQFRGIWNGGVLVTEGGYNPFRYAERYYREIFQHADKFVRDQASFIVYVVFPWFNSLCNGLAGDNERFYRTFSRRVFCEYRNSNAKMSELVADFSGDQSVWEVSNDISGILFLEDRSILGNSRNKSKLNGYWYFNPNSKNRLNHPDFRNWLHMDSEVSVLDDFRYDNY